MNSLLWKLHQNKPLHYSGKPTEMNATKLLGFLPTLIQPYCLKYCVIFVDAFFFQQQAFSSQCPYMCWVNKLRMGLLWSTVCFLSGATLVAAKENKFLQWAGGGWAATLESMWLPSEKRLSSAMLDSFQHSHSKQHRAWCWSWVSYQTGHCMFFFFQTSLNLPRIDSF